MISINSLEDLRKELAIVNKDIADTQSKMTMLAKYRKDLLGRIRELEDETTVTLDISEFTGSDPILEAMNTLRDTDEIRLGDLAHILGVSKTTLLKKVNPAKVRKISRMDINKHAVLLVSVDHVKELLSAHNEADKDKREFVKDILEYYYNHSLEISIGLPMNRMKLIPYLKPEYKDLDLRELIIGGFNRGFIKTVRYNTVMRLLDSFNCPFYIDYFTRTVKKRKDNKCIITVFSN